MASPSKSVSTAAPIAPKHNCFADVMHQVQLEKRGVWTVKSQEADPIEADWECPVCLEAATGGASDRATCTCSKIPARFCGCKHVIHVGCYLSCMRKKKTACPQCQVVPVFKELPSEIAAREHVKVPVPDRIPTLRLIMASGSAMEVTDVDATHTVRAALWDTTLARVRRQIIAEPAFYTEEHIRLRSLGRVLDWNKCLRDYPGVHLDVIFIRA